MADGLRLLGFCPRCDGELDIADDAPDPPAADTPAADTATEPHLALGLPRPPKR